MNIPQNRKVSSLKILEESLFVEELGGAKLESANVEVENIILLVLLLT